MHFILCKANHWLATCSLAAVLAVLPTGLSAQARLEGHVVDDGSEEPIREARVLLLGEGGDSLGITYTDSLGSFTLSDLRLGALRLHVERLGYRAATTPVLHLSEKESLTVRVRLNVEAVLMAPLEVVARSSGGPGDFLSDFRRRVERGNGWYITAEEVERRKPALVTDLLASVPGVRLISQGRGTTRVVRIGRATLARGDCPVQFYIDGILASRAGAIPIDEMVAAGSVEGIEIYNGLSTVPPEFLSPEAVCGVVVIWTRRGG